MNLKQVIGKIQTAEKNVEFNFLVIGENLSNIKEITKLEKFEEIIKDNFKFGVSTAYAMLKVWNNREQLDFGKYGFWKAHELVKIADEQERREFEDSFKPEERSVREVREDIKLFKTNKNIENDNIEDYSHCTEFMFLVKKVQNQTEILKDNLKIIENLWDGIQVAHKDK